MRVNRENPNRETPVDNMMHIRMINKRLSTKYLHDPPPLCRILRLIISVNRRGPPLHPSLTRTLQFLPRTARNKAPSLKARQMHFTRENGSRVTRIKVLLHAGGASERRQESSRARRLGRRRQRTDADDVYSAPLIISEQAPRRRTDNSQQWFITVV